MLSYFVYAVDYSMQTYIVNPKTFFSSSRSKFRRNVQKLVIFLSKNRNFSTYKCLFIKDMEKNSFLYSILHSVYGYISSSLLKIRQTFYILDILILFFFCCKVIQNTTINPPCYFLLISSIIQFSFFFCM